MSRRRHITGTALHQIEFPSNPWFGRLPGGSTGWVCGNVLPGELAAGAFENNIFETHIILWRARGVSLGDEMPTCPYCAALVLETLARYAQRLMNHQPSAASSPPVTAAGTQEPSDSP